MALDTIGCSVGRVKITDRCMTSTSRSFKPSCTSGFAPLARANSWCARCSGVSKLCQQQVSSSEAAKDLLNWLADQRGAIRTAVEVDESPSGAGRRLLAGRNFAADEVLMSVPFTSVFVDIEVILPHIHFSDADMVALQDPETVQEVQAMRLSHEACFQVFLRLQTFSEISIVLKPQNMPRLFARCVYSPEASQGRQAEEDVCQPPPAQPAMFQLLSGPDGVRQAAALTSFFLPSGMNGEEVTISYGDWPNDVFLLFFGFLPEGNQHDSVVLFDTLQDLAQCYDLLVQQQGQPMQQQQQHPQEAQRGRRRESRQNQHLQHQRGKHPRETEVPEPQASTSDEYQQPAGHHQLQPQAHASSSHGSTEQGLSRSSQLEQADVGATCIRTQSDSDHSSAQGDAAHVEAASQPEAGFEVHANSMPESQSSGSGTEWTQRQLALLQARLGPGDWTR
ncbi:MAG: hypothetical protein FRX49_10792 [Trebouxia sp. A1-2]|nr:MAG: hypothetical protein FRX49_10792 [Trebouxia sp. A1-2]